MQSSQMVAGDTRDGLRVGVPREGCAWRLRIEPTRGGPAWEQVWGTLRWSRWRPSPAELSKLSASVRGQTRTAVKAPRLLVLPAQPGLKVKQGLSGRETGPAMSAQELILP